MLSKQTNFNLKNYKGLFKEWHTNIRAHGGVTIFIHKTNPYQKVILNTPVQAIAARISIGRDVTIVSIYNSRIHDISENPLSTLLQQLPKPVILTGDFNSLNQIWGSPVDDNRGDNVLSFINKNQLNILNDRRHTRTSGTLNSAIDPFLQPILSWNVIDSPACSDHWMITVNIQSKNSGPQTAITKFNINKANWHLFTSNEAWKEVTNPNRSQSTEAQTKYFHKKKSKFPQNLLYQC